jgi:hypothetical protein
MEKPFLVVKSLATIACAKGWTVGPPPRKVEQVAPPTSWSRPLQL